MILAKINARVVGAIFGTNGSRLRDMEKRHHVSVDAKSFSADGNYRLIRVSGNQINICGILAELACLVDSSDIVISSRFPGMMYTYLTTILNPLSAAAVPATIPPVPVHVPIPQVQVPIPSAPIPILQVPIPDVPRSNAPEMQHDSPLNNPEQQPIEQVDAEDQSMVNDAAIKKQSTTELDEVQSSSDENK